MLVDWLSMLFGSTTALSAMKTSAGRNCTPGIAMHNSADYFTHEKIEGLERLLTRLARMGRARFFHGCGADKPAQHSSFEFLRRHSNRPAMICLRNFPQHRLRTVSMNTLRM